MQLKVKIFYFKKYKHFTDVNDIDTPLKNVTIRVVDIVSGYIAIKGDLENPVDHFTQADIDNRQVIFVHKSKLLLSFRYTFSVKKKLLRRLIDNICFFRRFKGQDDI